MITLEQLITIITNGEQLDVEFKSDRRNQFITLGAVLLLNWKTETTHNMLI